MDIRLTDVGEDYGTLEVLLGEDDRVEVSGYGHEISIKLPLYDHEAAELIEVLSSIARKETE